MWTSELLVGARLARWLGPWAGESVPPGVPRRAIELPRTTGGGHLRAYVYEPPRPSGVFVVVPGLHFAGPDDPRLDRFCRVLAAAGHLVVAPFLPSFSALVVEAVVTDDLADVFDEAERQGRSRGLAAPALLSISFGGLPSAALAARATHARRIGGWISFGGYCDFGATVRFALSGRFERDGRTHEAARDPLNAPVVILNVLPFLELDPAIDRVRLAAALREVAHRTWGKMELKLHGARDPIVRGVADPLPPALRELVLVASGVEPGAIDLLEAGLARAGAAFDFADPRPHLGRVEAPVVVVHGRDDDVIPWVEAEKLGRALPPGKGQVLLTGLWGHTGTALPHPADAVREARSMLGILAAVTRAPRRA